MRQAILDGKRTFGLFKFYWYLGEKDYTSWDQSRLDACFLDFCARSGGSKGRFDVVTFKQRCASLDEISSRELRAE